MPAEFLMFFHYLSFFLIFLSIWNYF